MRNSPLRAFANGDKEKKEVKYDLSKATVDGKKVKKEKSSFDSRFTPVNQADLPKPKLKRRKK